MNFKCIKTLILFIPIVFQTNVLQAAERFSAKRLSRSSSTDIKRSVIFKPSEIQVKTTAELDEIISNFNYTDTCEKIRRLMNKPDYAADIAFMAPEEATHVEVITSLYDIVEKEPDLLNLTIDIVKDYINHLMEKPDNYTVYLFSLLVQTLGGKDLSKQLSEKLWYFVKTPIDLNDFSEIQIANALTQRDANLVKQFNRSVVEDTRKNKGRCDACTLHEQTVNDLSLWLLCADEESQQAIGEKIQSIGHILMELENGSGVAQINNVFQNYATHRMKVFDSEQVKNLAAYVPDKGGPAHKIRPFPLVLAKFNTASETKADVDVLQRKWQKNRATGHYAAHELSAPEALLDFFSRVREKLIPEQLLLELSHLSWRPRNEVAPVLNEEIHRWNQTDLDYFFRSWDRVKLWKRLAKNGFYDMSHFQSLYDNVPEQGRALTVAMWLNIDEELAANLLAGQIGTCFYKPKSLAPHSKRKESKNIFGDLQDVEINLNTKATSESTSSGEGQTETPSPLKRSSHGSSKRRLPRRLSKENLSHARVVPSRHEQKDLPGGASVMLSVPEGIQLHGKSQRDGELVDNIFSNPMPDAQVLNLKPRKPIVDFNH